MKTKVRIIFKERSSAYNYEHLHIQFLQKAYPFNKTSKSLDQVFEITFQRDYGTGVASHWYAMKYEIATKKISEIKYMLSIAQYLEKAESQDRIDGLYSDFSNPEVILKALNAERYQYHHGNYIPESQSGYEFYKVLYDGDKVWSHIIAKNEKAAKREFVKMVKALKLREASFEFDHIVPDLREKSKVVELV
jgi:hypothetical protein